MYRKVTRDDLESRKFGAVFAKEKTKQNGDKYSSVSGNIDLRKFGFDYKGVIKFIEFVNHNRRNDDDPYSYLYVAEDDIKLLKIPVEPRGEVNWDKYNIPEFK